MSDISENEVIEENSEEVPLTKQKKPRSQAQVEAFEKVKEKRRQNLESKKQEKLLKSAKLLIEEENKKLLEPTVPVKPPSRQSKKYRVKGERRVPYAEPEPESEIESEEEVIVVRKARRNTKPKKQKKVRKIIIEQSSSEEEDEDEDEESKQEYYQSSKRYNSIPQIIRPNPNDIFC